MHCSALAHSPTGPIRSSTRDVAGGPFTVVNLGAPHALRTVKVPGDKRHALWIGPMWDGRAGGETALASFAVISSALWRAAASACAIAGSRTMRSRSARSARLSGSHVWQQFQQRQHVAEHPDPGRMSPSRATCQLTAGSDDRRRVSRALWPSCIATEFIRQVDGFSRHLQIIRQAHPDFVFGAKRAINRPRTPAGSASKACRRHRDPRRRRASPQA